MLSRAMILEQFFKKWWVKFQKNIFGLLLEKICSNNFTFMSISIFQYEQQT
jgi:hypothetical protein